MLTATRQFEQISLQIYAEFGMSIYGWEQWLKTIPRYGCGSGKALYSSLYHYLIVIQVLL